MKCPFCRQSVTEVYNSRSTKFQSQIWRRRRCLSCGKAFTTYESADLGFIKVINNDKPHTYSRAKLFSSIYLAFLDVQDKDEIIDAVTDTVESKILDQKSRRIDAAAITEIILGTLKHFNTAAFMRYLASHAALSSSAQLKKELKKYK